MNRGETRLRPNPTDPIATISHPMHFIPGLSLQLAPRELNKAIGSDSRRSRCRPHPAGFAYTTDPATGEIRLAAATFGPVYAERALTIGKRRFDFGLSFQPTSFDSFETAELGGRQHAVHSRAQQLLRWQGCWQSNCRPADGPGTESLQPRFRARPVAVADFPRHRGKYHGVLRELRRHGSFRCRRRHSHRQRADGRKRHVHDRADGHRQQTVASTTSTATGCHSRSPRHVPPPAWATYCCARSTTSCAAAPMRSPPRSIFACRRAMKTTCWEPARRRRRFSSLPLASTGCSHLTRASVTRSPTAKSAISRRMWRTPSSLERGRQIRHPAAFF